MTGDSMDYLSQSEMAKESAEWHSKVTGQRYLDVQPEPSQGPLTSGYARVMPNYLEDILAALSRIEKMISRIYERE